MRIGINASVTGGSQFGKIWKDRAYEKLRKLGYSCIDLSCLGSFDHPYLTLPEQEAGTMILREKALAERAGMKLYQAHAPVIAKEQPYTEGDWYRLLEGIKRSIRLCDKADCRFLVIHPFMGNGWKDRGRDSAKATFEQNVTRTAALAAYAADYGVTLCYENMPCVDFSISHPHEIALVVKTVNHPNLGVCFDVGHTTAFNSGRSVGDQIRDLGEQIKVLHIHDTYGMADQHNLPGMGATDWASVRKGLADIGFQGVFSLEINSIFTMTEAIFADTYRLAYRMADEIINSCPLQSGGGR